MLRLRTEIWVQAYIRRCYRADSPAMVVHKGDPDAGIVYIKVNCLNDQVWVYGPAPRGLEEGESAEDRKWCLSLGANAHSEAEADQYLSRQRDRDRDLWVVEVEDRQGQHFLGDALVTME